MKRFIVFLCLSFLFFTLHASAAHYTYEETADVTLNITTKGNYIDIIVSHKGDWGASGQVSLWKEKGNAQGKQGLIYSQNVGFNDSTPQQVSFKISDLKPNTTYYLRYDTLATSHTYEIKTEATNDCPADPNPIAGSEKLGVTYEGSYIILSGKFDSTKHPCFQNFKASIETFKEDPAQNSSAARVFYTNAVQDKENRASGIAINGEYYYYITNVDPNTNYFFKQTVVDQSTNGKTVTSTGSFVSTKGFVPVGSTQQSFEEHSYRLLAPFPGFTTLMDPDLCAAQKAEHKIAPDAVCDINDLLNFAFKLVIGIAAVLLVFRIMLAGYQYITTDVPFLKNSAKTHITQSALGILLALSAYLILNTINPKLVSNNFHLKSLEVAIDNPEGIGSFDFNAIKSLKNISCPQTANGSIADIAKSFVGKVSYNQNRRSSVVNGDIYLDCSSYVSTVLNCAGHKINTDSTTAIIFGSGAEAIGKATTDYSKNVVNGKELKAGDLIGWPDPDGTGGKSGHVLIYIGSGSLAEVHGPTYPDKGGQKNGATRIISLNDYPSKDKFTYVKRLVNI